MFCFINFIEIKEQLLKIKEGGLKELFPEGIFIPNRAIIGKRKRNTLVSFKIVEDLKE